ncbi:MAG: biotin synthase BioB [Muribaculaceae bacterium]|nr:biotin synthase BioB [Muribaculaceae bacterium]
MDIYSIKERILAGGSITAGEAYSLVDRLDDEPVRRQLYEAAAEITAKFGPRKFDSCSIINARSGRCPENCKWCAQSAAYPTSVNIYPLVDHDVCMDMADRNSNAGIGRFSLVTSGRTVTGRALDTICEYYSELNRKGGLYLCASMGLLDDDAMSRLHEAGVKRYHCNLETSRSFFPTLCSTHTQEDKHTTIARARKAGMEICCGGIIGMGETMHQRVEFALDLREVDPVSVPLNILHPIPGTPLENQPPLADNEILDTVAIFRLVHPRVIIRFAGGRDRISPYAQREAMRIGVNGAIMGDLLTTSGAQIRQDKEMIQECGYEF